MPFVEYPQRAIALTIRKRLGLPNMCGWATCGWSQCGDDNIYTGMYQQRRNRKWNGVGGFIISNHQRNFVQCPSWPVQPPSDARDLQQDKFKTALLAWQSLTSEQKKYYNTIASRRSRRGYDFFMSKTLKSI